MIQFRDVSVCYDSSARRPANALEEVTLDIQAGEWVFFVGPSGAGKSTLLKLVYAGVLATRGRVFVDGQDVTSPSPQEIPLLRRKVGVVFQDFQLLSQKTVWENVAFALQVIGAPQKRLMRDVPRALETVGLERKGQARPHELSGGEQQRVAIARAIVNSPKVLIADEPTGNLDPRTADDIAEVLSRVNARGTTILMATHDRPLVDRLKKRVVRIADHRVVSDDAVGYYHPEDDAPTVFAQHFSPQDERDALALAATLEDEDDNAQNAARVLASQSSPRVAPPTTSKNAASSQSSQNATPPMNAQNLGSVAHRTVSAVAPDAPQNDAAPRDDFSRAVAPPTAASTRAVPSHHAADFSQNADMPQSPQNAALQFSPSSNDAPPRNVAAPMSAPSATTNVPQNAAPLLASTRDAHSSVLQSAPPSQSASPQIAAPSPASTRRDDADFSSGTSTSQNAAAPFASTRDEDALSASATFEAPHDGGSARSRNVSHAGQRVARDENAPLGSPENPILQHDSGSVPPL